MVWENGVTREYTAEEIAEMEASYQKAVEEGLITEDGESSVGGGRA